MPDMCSERPDPHDHANRHPAGTDRLGPWFSPLGIALLVPIVLVLVVLWTSPNYRLNETAHQTRPTPFGGDFLQEWVGGWIVLSNHPERLYRHHAFVQLQHRPDLVGFRWNAKRYYPPIYPPGYYVLVSPLARLAYPMATMVWLSLSAVALMATFALLYRFEPAVRRLYPWIPLATLFFVPLLLNLNIGHKATWLLLIFTSTYVLFRRQQPYAAGIVFGLVAFKPHLLVVLAGIAIWKRQWRFLIGLAVTGIGWIALCWLAGPGQLGEFVQTALRTGDYVQTGGYRLDMAHGLWGVFELTLGGIDDQGVKILVGLASLVVLGLIALVTRGPWAPDQPRFPHQFSAIVIATVLVSPHFYTYDLVLVLLPAMLTLGHAVPKATTWLSGIVAAFLLLAGLFQPIAATCSIQISTLLLVAWLVGLWLETEKAGKNEPGLTLDKPGRNWHIGYP